MSFRSLPSTIRGRLYLRRLAAIGLLVGGRLIAGSEASEVPTATVRIERGTMVIQASGADEKLLLNQGRLAGDNEDSYIVGLLNDSGSMEPTSPCRSGGEGRLVSCPLSAVQRFSLDSGDGDDSFRDQTVLAGTVRMGSGNDEVIPGLGRTDIDLGPGGDIAVPVGGAHNIKGGTGVDGVSYELAQLPVVVALDDKTNDGAFGKDNIRTDVENVVGTRFADELTGSGQANALLGLGGLDKLNGMAGNDLVDGGPDGDTLAGGSGIDTVNYAGYREAVTVRLDGSRSSGAPGEGDIVGTDVENIIGGAGSDRLFGNDLSNTIEGGGGNDKIAGLGGNDLAVAGSQGDGADVVSGGAGVDTMSYAGRSTGVQVDLDDKADDGASGEGDNIRPDVENLLGSASNDVLIGSAARNLIRGLDGNDGIGGLAGNDYLDGGLGRDTMIGGAGVDIASYTTHGGPVGVSLDNKANDGRPRESDNVRADIESVNGSNFADMLVGSSLNNTLHGFGGNDRLYGALGNDILIGDAGRDQGFGAAGRDSCITEVKSSCP
ncbi:calcium-binding protein [Kribbella catacumbae]|uniref:calcium-binding protein n=1 Tax=Kribbella catacumbae TaxID=460086 RepID=UPI0003645FD2|nr:calcium-binding protein [Kribbella catacumbae]